MTVSIRCQERGSGDSAVHNKTKIDECKLNIKSKWPSKSVFCQKRQKRSNPEKLNIKVVLILSFEFLVGGGGWRGAINSKSRVSLVTISRTVSTKHREVSLPQ